MKLHNQIMNIPVPHDFDYADFHSKVVAYKSGHRDARHAAAELVLKYDALIADLFDHIENFGGELFLERIKKEYNL